MKYLELLSPTYLSSWQWIVGNRIPLFSCDASCTNGEASGESRACPDDL